MTEAQFIDLVVEAQRYIKMARTHKLPLDKISLAIDLTDATVCMDNALRGGDLAVADIDTNNENAVADVLAHYGPSPLIARTPSGGHHLYYRHNSRVCRRVRDPYWLERGIPVDVLGNGFVVAPVSRSPRGTYLFVQGSLDDLLRVTVMRVVPAWSEPTAPVPAPPTQPVVPAGQRNEQLFRPLHAPRGKGAVLQRSARCCPQLQHRTLRPVTRRRGGYEHRPV